MQIRPHALFWVPYINNTHTLLLHSVSMQESIFNSVWEKKWSTVSDVKSLLCRLLKCASIQTIAHAETCGHAASGLHEFGASYWSGAYFVFAISACQRRDHLPLSPFLISNMLEAIICSRLWRWPQTLFITARILLDLQMPALPYSVFLCVSCSFSLFLKSAVINRALLNPAICLLIRAKKHQRVGKICPGTALDIIGMLWLTRPLMYHMEFKKESDWRQIVD